MSRNDKEVIDLYHKQGWYPLPTRHLPSHVRLAISKARFRPIMKGCFRNAQKLVLWQKTIPFTYCEGIVSSIKTSINFTHAWVKDKDGNHHDVTINPAPPILCYKEYSRAEVFENISKNQYYDAINPEWINKMMMALNLQIDLKLSDEKIDEIMEEKLKSFNALAES